MTDAAASEKKGNEKANHRKRNIWLIVVAAIFILVAIVWFIYWLLVGRFYVSTQDAYVHGNQVMLSPQVSSAIKAIYADETDLVKEGQLVIELERNDFEIAVEEARKTLADTVRSVSALFQDVLQRKAAVEMRRAEKRQADLDVQHRKNLVEPGAVAREQFQTFQTTSSVADSRLALAERELTAAESLVEGTTVETHPRVERAAWFLRQAYLNLIRCQIWAPATGYIAKRSGQVGDFVNAGQTLLFIVPLDQIWINANYKETQLTHVRIGQEVSYTADIYGRAVRYHGCVEGFQPGTGDAFSLLPPQNASGNWIKIIQRVPVRIKLDKNEIQDNPLLLGLSTRVVVDIHDTSGKILAAVPTEELIYSTFIYEKQMRQLKEFEPQLQKIIQENAFREKTPSNEIGHDSQCLS